MLDKKLSKVGSILMHKGKIEFEGFSANDCMCREVAILALIWGIGKMQMELKALIAKPGGTGNTAMDFSKELCKALDIGDRW